MNAACLALIVLLLTQSATSLAGPPPPRECVLNVHATGFRNEKGQADAAVFRSPEGWPEGKSQFVDDASPIRGGESTISFHIPPGRYSVVVLHDENSNHKMDRDILGVPKEGFGFSNNPHVFLKAPPFQQANFTVGCPVTNITVRIIYK